MSKLHSGRPEQNLAVLFKNNAAEIFLLLIGCVIYALSMIFISGINVIPGSFLGVAVALNKALGSQIGLVNFVLNVPVMLLVTRKMGVKVLVYTIFILAFTSYLIDHVTAIIAPPSMNIYVLSLTGGVVMGIGAGILILAKGTMAGTTALTLLIQRAVKSLSFGTILLILDSLIVIFGALVVRDFKAVLYSLLYSCSCAKTMDIIINLGKRFGLTTA